MAPHIKIKSQSSANNIVKWHLVHLYIDGVFCVLHGDYLEQLHVLRVSTLFLFSRLSVTFS